MTIVIDPCGDVVTIRPFGAGDVAALEAMVGRCSAQSLYRRFHGVVRGPARAVSLLAGPGQELYLAWRASRCVGVAGLGDTGDESPHMGVLVEDAWQRRGVGSALITALVARARERGAAALIADVLYEDRFVLGLLARIGSLRTTASNPGYTVSVELSATGGPATGTAGATARRRAAG